MGIYDRYVYRFFTGVLIICFSSLLAMYILVDCPGHLDEFLSYGEKIGSFWQVFSSYYGARNLPLLGEPLRAPIQFHFGDNDPSIPPEAVAAHRERQPGAEVHVYKGAGHAFNRDTDPAHYDGAAARLAHQRTMELFARALA